jgi:hypothetical protein
VAIERDTDYLANGPVDEVLVAVARRRPEVRIARIWVSHPADDDNLWEFFLPEIRYSTVQIETHPDGRPPYLIEGNGDRQRLETSSVQEAVDVILSWLATP